MATATAEQLQSDDPEAESCVLLILAQGDWLPNQRG